jgi:hypothetical protein
MAMSEAGMDKRTVARKLKRTVMAISSRLAKLRQRERQTNSALSAGRRGSGEMP